MTETLKIQPMTPEERAALGPTAYLHLTIRVDADVDGEDVVYELTYPGSEDDVVLPSLQCIVRHIMNTNMDPDLGSWGEVFADHLRACNALIGLISRHEYDDGFGMGEEIATNQGLIAALEPFRVK